MVNYLNLSVTTGTWRMEMAARPGVKSRKDTSV